jgi:hypothetical protein
MRLEILHVLDCPSTAVLEARLAAVLPAIPFVQVSRHVVNSESEALRVGMVGSPTILVDRVDQFAPPGMQPSLLCRTYRDELGNLGPAPSTGLLRHILAGHSQPE